MATKLRPRKPESDSYMTCVARFPLKPIKNDVSHEQAVEMIGSLLGNKLDMGASDYLETLILLVNKYEDENHAPMNKELSPQEVILAIMHTNGLSQNDIGKIIGSESAVSMFLSGARGLSKAHIRALVSRFHVDASIFL